MTAYNAVYPAFVVDASSSPPRVRIPQLFADLNVPLHSATVMPEAGQSGWVSFANGQAEYPVWLGASTF